MQGKSEIFSRKSKVEWQKKGGKRKKCIIGTLFVLDRQKTNVYETDFFSFDGFDAVRRHGGGMYEEG